ncbi:MAG: HAMP domain-containing histidine kinase [Nitrospiraceae bacterium]|nr:MAG: HAMP domain-containing histidine kinase [Nitrospiraceae bacterium]
MRTKLFLAFIFIIFLALLSNIIFERLIIEDFNDFVMGHEEDNIYWIMASVEGCYDDKEWDMSMLKEALHWGLMLGLETYVEDGTGQRVLSSSDVLSEMTPNMMERMTSFLNLSSGLGEFIWYPLYLKGEEIGKLYVRPIERLGMTPQKEEIFRNRGREFLIISFLIAGGGALLMSILFTIFLSNPIRRLTVSAEKIAGGDFSVNEPVSNRKRKDELDKLTQSFNYMAEALRREDALRKHLTSNIAHELRTPLTIMKGNLEAIEDGIISDPKVVIDSIRTEIERLVSLVEGIEDLTRAEASFFKRGDQEEINLKEFVQSVSESMNSMVIDKGLYLRINGPDILVKADPEKLHIILKNLVTNAVKFTDTGGITIHWGNADDKDPDLFFLAVSDTGKGIEDDELPKIFDRFYKGKDSQGKGLGLAIVKEIVEAIGGQIEVERGSEGGLSIRITM